ncbi:MAG: hypothetical protein KAH16_03640 [Candidatus Izimaplasma sp.]|nr:hypothetical protein [Candidatus Izimaplasma bacterium]
MNKLYILVIILFVTLLSSCTNEISDNTDRYINEGYVLEPLLMVENPVESESQDESILGVMTESVSVTDIEWETIYESTYYSILSREVSDEMAFYMIGYHISSDDSCLIGARTRYQYVIFSDGHYFDIWEYDQKYHNLSCELLNDIGIL